VVDVVSNINATTLVTNGEYDEAGDVAIKPHLDSIPNVQYKKYFNASHTAQYETPDVVLETVGNFLTS
jgi:pimeloyl-ACP methyl ester carboxylesterase